MKKIEINNTKYEVDTTTNFKKQLKKTYKQGKDIEKLIHIIERLANEEKLEEKYKGHNLTNDKKYKNCRECHIDPDWLLIYQIIDNRLILLLIGTGSHSDLFNK